MIAQSPRSRSRQAATDDFHRRQVALVRASVVAVPGGSRTTHRRWA